MTMFDWAAIAAFAAIVLVFYAVRRIPAYIAATTSIVVGFAAATAGPVAAAGGLADWAVMVLGLLSCTFGLLIVRVMLIRSVSLLLLSRLGGETGDLFRADIRGRLDDMRRFNLIRPSRETNTLTTFGRFIAGSVAMCYAVFRIKP
jgi:hypothetical protein